MQMDSATTLQGVKLAKAVPFEVHWSKSMLFSGKHAEFSGDIQEEQEEARLASQGLQVFFDTPISLKEGTRRESSPKVEHIVCDRQVRVEETVRDKDKLVRFQRIVAVTLSMNRLDQEEITVGNTPPGTPPAEAPTREKNEVRATGPGEVRLLQRGGGGDSLDFKPRVPAQPVGANGPKPNPAKPADEGKMKMTHISFLKSMYANNRSNTATFLEEVRVLHFPCEDPNVEVELENVLDRLPPDAIFLRCDRLDALSRGEGKNARQDMRARGRVTVQAREFSGRAEMVTYEDAKEQVIFHGTEGAPAVLMRQVRVGAPPEEIRGRKITYSRGTGQFKIDDGQWLGGGS
jgi:lipopolysaccharide export system protein LptA